MALHPKENHKEEKDKMQKERRSFLKKTAYAAPALIALGQLARPTQSMAADSWDPGPGATNTWTGGQ